jgi:hypothetical protein
MKDSNYLLKGVLIFNYLKFAIINNARDNMALIWGLKEPKVNFQLTVEESIKVVQECIKSQNDCLAATEKLTNLFSKEKVPNVWRLLKETNISNYFMTRIRDVMNNFNNPESLRLLKNCFSSTFTEHSLMELFRLHHDQWAKINDKNFIETQVDGKRQMLNLFKEEVLIYHKANFPFVSDVIRYMGELRKEESGNSHESYW